MSIERVLGMKARFRRLRQTYEAGKQFFGWGQPGRAFPFDGIGYHLYIAEASLHGDFIVEKNALIKTRRTVGVGEHSTYFKKHISDDMQIASIVTDFEKQLEWICHINSLSYAGFPEATKNITLAGSLGIYFSLFGIAILRSVDGALEAWLESPTGLAIASQMNAIGSNARLHSAVNAP